MKKTIFITIMFATVVFFSIYAGCGSDVPNGNSAVLAVQSPASNGLPQDVLQSCTISQSEFNSWFTSGTATENGLVMPANSVTFGHNNNCDFYKWSWQMFSWMVSPQPGGLTTIESPVFYTVSAPDSVGNNVERILIPHEKGKLMQVSSAISEAGPHNLQIIRDKQGNHFEVQPHSPIVKPMLLSGAQVHTVELDAAQKPVFKDKSGKVIANPKAKILTQTKAQNIVQEFKTANGTSVFLSADGKIVESESGQATGDALIAQNGSLVYYITMVNDVYAFYLSGAKNNLIDDATFPTTAQQRDSICAIARANGVTLPDSNALAIEIKSSWVEAVNLPNPIGSYVTIDALIPTYNTSNPNSWTVNGERKAKLALVGVHVVGSTAGHPEMVWATFEHQRNAPNAAYQYLDSQKATKVVPADNGGTWLFTNNATDANPNQSHIGVPRNTNNLNSKNGFAISASNTSMVFPWGSQMNVSPNAEDGSSAASNSEVISINNGVFGWLVGNDVRKNYLLIGATWTSGGAIPNGQSYSADTNNPKLAGDAIGTSLLANSTMETYFQKPGKTCFTCHSGSGLLPTDLSHVYGELQPVPNFKILPKK